MFSEFTVSISNISNIEHIKGQLLIRATNQFKHSHCDSPTKPFYLLGKAIYRTQR